jgi:hypothetical protein
LAQLVTPGYGEDWTYILPGRTGTVGPWESKPAEVLPDAGSWISGPQEPVNEEQQQAERQRRVDIKLAAMTSRWQGASIFRIAGGWGAIAGEHEWAATGNTLEELDEKLDEYFG